MKSKLRLKSDYRSQKINIIFAARRVVSSVGLEHYLDRVGVTGSNPVQPTEIFLYFKILLSGIFSFRRTACGTQAKDLDDLHDLHDLHDLNDLHELFLVPGF